MTNQKEIILGYLKGAKSHPTAEEIYKAVKKKLPRISRATVYRILKDYTTKGEIQELSFSGASRFDADTNCNVHFICQNCNKIFDITESFCNNCNIIKSGQTKAGKIEKSKIRFYGQCKKCQKK
jgi:Fe2+ or Zn2+ uptake regulation protein